MTAEQWQQHYDFPKPGPYDPVIMQCRTNRRAAWAAQLAKDAGLQNCLVYKQVSHQDLETRHPCVSIETDMTVARHLKCSDAQGVYGWHLDPVIKSYRSYEKWGPPPEPEPFAVETVNVAAAGEELADLGL